MKRTLSSAKSFVIAMLQGVLIFLLAIGVISSTIFSFLLLDALWGLFAFLFFSFVAFWFYFTNMQGVKTNVSDHLDAFVATLSNFAGTLLVIFFGMVLGSWIKTITTPAYGWLSFAAFIACVFACYLKSHKNMVERHYN